ncbi:MAG: LamG-like jellyroll fold domain-containing protein [Pseudomonadota bacterium]
MRGTTSVGPVLVFVLLAASSCSSGDSPPVGLVFPDTGGLGDATEDVWVPPDLPGGMCGGHGECEPGWCDPATLTCVVCLEDEHCPKDWICQDKQCVKGPDGCASDGDCPEGVCDETTGECVSCLEDDDCDDGFRCDPEGCVQRVCAPGALTCFQDMVQILCNTDGSGTAWEKSCSDNNPCTEGDGCADGECLEPVPVDCDDENPCTDDDCGGPAGGCYYTFNTEPCDDGFECTIDDHCQSGECKGGSKICSCVSDADCDIYEDGDACNGTLNCDADGTCSLDEDTIVSCPATSAVCKEFVCQPATGNCALKNLVQGVPCEDDNPCTLDEWCEAGACIGLPLNCDDGNPCTDEVCVPGEGCMLTFNNKPCNDGAPCTWPDACVEGICLGPDFDCNDGNPCTQDSCDEATGCVNQPFQGPCDDGDACTTGDVCEAGVCAGAPVSCADANFCTNDICDPGVGCTFPFNDLPCDDGNPCTENDHCYQGSCIPGQTLVDCDDGNPCTTDTCDVDSGECFHAPNTFTCEDGSPCTLGDHCVNGVCQPGGQKDCDDQNPCTNDACLPANGACQHLPGSGPCDDGNLCTTGDHCQASVCIPTGSVDCFDGNPCTADACLPSLGCKTSNLDGIACDDQNLCTQGDHCAGGACVSGAALVCDDGNGCTADTCHPVFSCQYQDLITPCDDGNPCTLTDQCQGGLCIGSAPKDCNDGDPCTQDWCEPGFGCKFAPDNGAACDDGDPCSFEDLCQAGQCISQTGHVNCDDGDVCTKDECGVNDCVHFVLPGPCDDEDPCTVGDQCVGGTCAGQAVPNCGCGSLLFDGSGDRVVVPAQALLSVPGAFTLEAWIKLQANTAGVVFALDRGPGVSGRVWRGWVAPGGAFLFQTYGPSGAQVSAALDFQAGWQHVAVVHTGTALQIWVDGIKASQATGVAVVPAVDNLPLAIGCAWDPVGGAWSSFFEGGLDEIRLSDAVIYSAPFNPAPSLEGDDDTVALWSFDQTQGNVAFDVGAWLHHGYLQGDPAWSTATPPDGTCAPVPNYPPSTPVISLVPDLPVDDDPLECQVIIGSFDPENDPVAYTYTWYKDGVIQPQITGAVVPAEATSGCPAWNCGGCEEWTCAVTPSDPSHPGLPASDNATVGLEGCESCIGTVFGGNCYKYFSGQFSWNGAQMNCGNWATGGHLATITSGVENNFVKTLAASVSWIGASDGQNEGVWKWVTGEAWGWTGWTGSEPNNAGNEDCAAISGSGAWNDLNCTNVPNGQVLGYLCEDDWDQ